MTGHGSKLPRKRDQAVVALLTHSSIPEAARAVKIGEKTLWRWLQDDEFKEAYRTARSEIVRHAMVQVQAGMSKAVQTLMEVMVNDEAPASSRVSAAKTMLDLGVKSVELEDIERRLKKLETEISGRWQ